MILFSKRAKYIIYTFVIKVLNKKVLEEIKSFNLTKKSAMKKKNCGLLTSLVKKQQKNKKKHKPSQDTNSKLP